MRHLLLIPVIIAVISLFAIVKSTHAIDVTVQGNSGSNNVTVNQQSNTTINQNNNATLNNNVNVNCDTGGNSASNNTGGNTGVNTGNCKADATVQNNLNTNIANVDCPNCPKASPSPTPKPGSTPPPSGGGNGAGGGNGGPGGGGQAAGDGQVLAAAGVAKSTILYSLGFLTLLAGTFTSLASLRKVSL